MTPNPSENSHHAGATQAIRAAGAAPIDLLTAPLWKALIFMALPATIGFVFNTLYNVVDLIYARSWETSAGSSTQDALGATFPLFFFQLAFGIGLYQGTTALISNAYGRGDLAQARILTIQATTYGFLNGLIVAILGLIFLYPILGYAQGLEGQELDWAAGYMVAVFAGGPLIIANFALYALLSGAGNNRAFGLSLTIAFFLNIVFNYIFMHFFGLGIVGLGVATVLIQGPLNFLYVAFEVRLLGALKGARLADFIPQLPYMRRVMAQALPASFSMLMVAASILITNFFAGFYGGGTLGGLSAGARIEQVMLLPVIGVGIGSLAIIGQNQGAGQIDRVRATFWLTTKVVLTLTVISAALLLIFRIPLSHLVATPGREADVAAEYLIYSGLGAVFFGLFYIATSFKTGVRRPLFSAYVNLFRLIVFPLAFTSLFRLITPEFIAIPWGILTSGIIVGLASYIWVVRSVRRLRPAPAEI